MFRYKLDNGKYAYKFDPHEIDRIKQGDAIVIDNESRTVEVGYLSREWDKDEDVLFRVRNVNLKSSD